MNISLIVTVRNEGDTLRPLLDSLIEQTLRPDEIIICDGGSTDNTLEVLQEYQRWLPITIIEAPGSTISQGRNRAIAVAVGPLIAVTDAGVILSPVWLEEISRPILENQATVVSGWFEADPYTDFEVVMGATVLPELSDIDPQKFLPSSRSIAFLKSAWQTANGYPEWLDYSEDLVFDLALYQTFGPFAFAPNAVAYFRPRGTLRSFFRQYFFYGRGDGKANLWPKRHLSRYVTYGAGLPILLWLLWRGKRGSGLLLAGSVMAYCARPGQRLWAATNGWRPPSRLRAFVLIPIIRLVGDVAKMVGYPAGVMWRFRNRQR